MKVSVYVEGGGDKAETRSALRLGLGQFLRNGGIKPKTIVCGGRRETFDRFRGALKNDPTVFNILLVDSEAKVIDSPWVHLHTLDNWEMPGVADDRCHLMVQVMESWFLADLDVLRAYYGKGFLDNALPKNPNIEEIDKTRISEGLRSATKPTIKGCYHKIRHASKLLELLTVSKVRQASPHCDRLFRVIASKMEAQP